MKKLLCLLLCFLMLLSVTACGVDETAKSSSSDVVTSKETSSVTSKEESSSKEENSSSCLTSTEKISSIVSTNSSKPAKPNSSSDKTPTVNTSSTTSSNYPRKQKAIQIRKANLSSFKILGRGDNISPYTEIALNWTCSSVEFDVDCMNELGVEFTKGSGSNSVYVEIYVDGELIEERTKIENSGVITIADALEPGIHRVKIVRQSDCECPTLTLTKIHAYGLLVNKAPKNKALYIEAIGDASLIGWGVRLDDDFYKDFSANSKTKQPIARNRENEDGTLAYTYVAAEKLNADTYTLAKQGVGIAATYHKTATKINDENVNIANARAGLLPTMYDYSLPNGNVKHTPTRMPDVIVIDAGSADLSKSCQETVLDGNALGINTVRATQISLAFLTSLRGKNPTAKIIWCYGLTSNNESLEKYVTTAINSAGGASKGFYSLKLSTSARNGYPSEKEYAAAANLLVNKISQIIK